MRSAKEFQHTVVVLGAGGPAIQEWKKEGAEVVVLRSSVRRFEQYRKLRRLVAAVRPEGVILWTNARAGLLVSACHLAGVRRVAVHVGNPVEFSPKNRLAARLYEALPKATVAVLVAVSKHVAKSIEQEETYSRYSLKVVHNAIDLEAFAFRAAVRGNGTFKVGMVARLNPIKDHATLIRAWPNVVKKNPGAILELAGDGVMREGLEGIARDTGCREQIRFLSWVQDVPGVMRTWDMAVHSTTAQEGLGNSMLEAMTMGLPLVATDVGPVREVTDEGRAAILVPPREPETLAIAIRSVIENPEATARRVGHARRYVEKEFSIEAMRRGYMECLGL